MTTITIERGALIDPYLRAHRQNTRFVLGEGVYFTEGAGSFVDLDSTMLASGCELIGDGSKRTEIQVMTTKVNPGAGQIECLTAGSRSNMSQVVNLQGFRLIGPSSHDRMAPDLANLGIVGVHVWSDTCQLKDITVCNITGTRASSGPSREGFGVLVNKPGSSGYSQGRADVSDITVVVSGSPANGEHFVCAFYVGYATPELIASARRIMVLNTSAFPGHAAFGVNGNVMASEIQNVGRWNRAVFCDTDSGANTTISDSLLRAERVGVEFRTQAGQSWRNITVRDSVITLEPPMVADYAAGLVLVDDSPDKTGIFDRVTIRDSLFRFVPSGSQPFYSGSASGKVFSYCGLRGCGSDVAWKNPVLAGGAPKTGFTVS